MSADALRQMFRDAIRLNVYGNGETVGGEAPRIAAGECKSYDDYRYSCGYVCGLNTAAQMLEDCYKQLFDPQPETDEEKT